MITRYQRVLMLLVLSLFLAGCGSTPDVRYFTLDTEGENGALKQEQPLYVSRVQVPDYLDDNRIWVRAEAHRIEALKHVRWAESPPRAITRSLQFQLGSGISEPVDAPRVLVDIQRLEAVWGNGDSPDRVVLAASWLIEGHGDSQRITLEKPLPDRSADTLVALKSGLIRQLAQLVADHGGAD